MKYFYFNGSFYELDSEIKEMCELLGGNLKKGVFLYLGHAEHLGKVSKDFEIVKISKRFQ